MTKRNKQIQNPKISKIKSTLEKDKGWVDIGGTRMCLLDILGGWFNIGLSITHLAGKNTAKRVFFEAGCSGTFLATALEKGFLNKTDSGFCDAVETFSEAGFGNFIIRELSFQEGYARITCCNTFEGWTYLMNNKKFSESPECYYSTGVLLSFMRHILGKKELVAAETKCIAKGDSKCEFVIGSKQELQHRGISVLEWETPIKEKVAYLKNLLNEKNKITQELSQKNSELLLLNKISSLANQSLDINNILNFAIRELSKILGKKGIGIYLVDHKKEELVFRAQKGFSKGFFKSVSKLKFGEGLSGNVAQKKAPMAYGDYTKYPRALRIAVKDEKIKSLLSVPLMAKGKIVGVLNIATKIRHHFKSDEIRLITLIGNQIGVAIENSKLYKEIRESENKYKTLVEDINDGYLVCQEEKVIYVNDAFLVMYGYRIEDVLLSNCNKFIPKNRVPKLANISTDDIVNIKIKENIEFLRKCGNGKNLPTELKINIVEFNGKPAIVGVLRDVTEREKLELKILENQKMAAIGQVTTGIAHEIRNPLSAIKTNVQLLSKNLNLEGFNKRRLEIVAGEIDRLDRMLGDVLDFARPLKIERVNHNIHEIIEKCFDLLNGKIISKNINIIRKMSGQTQNAPMDCEKMEQVFLNIILNAIEAITEKGTIEIITRRIKHLEREVLEVTINDTGNGILQEYLNKVFDPFFTTKSKGMGLGLSIVKRIIEAHNGTIEIKSKVKKGSSVKLFLPTR